MSSSCKSQNMINAYKWEFDRDIKLALKLIQLSFDESHSFEIVKS